MASTAAATVGLFAVPPDIDPDMLLWGVTAYERQRYQTLKRRPRRAEQYLASRWLLRAHLAPQLGLQPIDVPLHTPANGPPTVPNTGYRLGLSHSHGLCLCITSTQARVGCDVEYHRPGRPLRAIATRFFHPAEAAHLNAVADAHAREDFYRLWTLKEAAQKALGRGIAGGLHTPAFALTPTLHCLNAPSGVSWTFAARGYAASGERYSLALAIAGAAPPARFTVTDYAIRNAAHRRRCRMRWQVTIAHEPNGQRSRQQPPTGHGPSQPR